MIRNRTPVAGVQPLAYPCALLLQAYPCALLLQCCRQTAACKGGVETRRVHPHSLGMFIVASFGHLFSSSEMRVSSSTFAVLDGNMHVLQNDVTAVNLGVGGGVVTLLPFLLPLPPCTPHHCRGCTIDACGWASGCTLLNVSPPLPLATNAAHA
jgi:hypothetical protein